MFAYFYNVCINWWLSIHIIWLKARTFAVFLVLVPFRFIPFYRWRIFFLLFPFFFFCGSIIFMNTNPKCMDPNDNLYSFSIFFLPYQKFASTIYNTFFMYVRCFEYFPLFPSEWNCKHHPKYKIALDSGK